jgi:Flp pilus assembly pilin Flp
MNCTDTDTDIDISPDEQQGLRSERGQTLVEYAMILGAVSIMALGLTPLGQWAATRLATLAGAL